MVSLSELYIRSIRSRGPIWSPGYHYTRCAATCKLLHTMYDYTMLGVQEHLGMVNIAQIVLDTQMVLDNEQNTSM